MSIQRIVITIPWSIWRTKSQKSILRPLFQKGGLSKLKNVISTRISRLSQRYGLVLFKCKLNLWISRLDLRPKCFFSEISGQKIIIWGKFLIKTFEATPLSFLCAYLHPLNYHNILKYKMEAFRKTCAPRCEKLALFLK